MFFQLLAQNEDILDSMVNSEATVQELNQRLVDLKIDYESLTQNATPMSFFNFENIYFWFVVCGLLILAFALWFLWLELKIASKTDKVVKHESNKEEKSRKIKQKKVMHLEPVEHVSEPRSVVRDKKVYQVSVRKTK